jgi:hypothetical protein
MNESLHLFMEIALNRRLAPLKCLLFGWLEKVAELPYLVAPLAPYAISNQGTLRTLNFLPIIYTSFFFHLPPNSRNGRVASTMLLILLLLLLRLSA